MISVSLLSLLLSLAIVAVVVFPLADALRKHPSVFYAIAVVATAVYAWAVLTGFSLANVRVFQIMMQKAYPASLLLALVMFAGVLPDDSTLRRRLMPIRGELSILSFILYLGHLAFYLPGYLPRLGFLLSSGSNVAVSLVFALLLTALFAVLGVTSFKFVRSHMSPPAWRTVQKGAYVMVALLLVHICLVLGRSALKDPFSTAGISLAVYVVLIVCYAALRIRKALRA